MSCSRRGFLVTGASALIALTLGPARARAMATRPRRLKMLSTHTGERVDVTYSEGGDLLPDALEAIDRFLRDFRTGEVHPIDPSVLDIVWALAHGTDHSAGTFEIISGYRSPRTNALLHERSAGVAVHSMHLEGRAIDLRLTGVPTQHLRDVAIELQRGGVGFYPSSDFVHVDTGRVRRW